METESRRKLLLALGLAIVCAAAYVYGYGSLLTRGQLPGLGLTVTEAALLLGGGLLIGKRAKWSAGSVFLLLCAALLAACYTLFGSVAMKLFNLPVLLLVTAQALFSLAGLNVMPSLSAQGMWEGLRRLLYGIFENIPAPFRALARPRLQEAGEGEFRRERKATGVLSGVLIAVPVVAVVLALLASADAVFGSAFTRAFDRLGQVDIGLALWHLLRVFALTLPLFSLLYALTRPARAFAPAVASAPPAVFRVLEGALCAVYAAFVYVQLRYLFGGAETAALNGGYAEYARSGFFQLVAVALINLTVLGLAQSLCGADGALRGLGLALVALTAVILYSAFWRMRLYIQAYGLSVLRLLTLWAMAMIAVALLLTAARLLCPRLRVFPVLIAVVLAGWLALNYCNVDYTVARFSVQAQQVDVEYLATLSPDVLPALEEETRQLVRKKQRRGRIETSWYCWNRSLLWIEQE